MANDVFLKKVYDQYLNTDYEYGVSNLNPKREISPGLSSLDDDLSKKIEDEVRRQFNLIKEDAKQFLNFTTPKPSVDAEKAKEKAGSILSSNHNSTLKTVPKLGGSLYDAGLEESPLVDEIDDLIFKLGLISTVIDPTKDKPYDDIGKGTNPANQITFLNGCCICHGGNNGGKSSKDKFEKINQTMVPVGPEDDGLLNSDEIGNNSFPIPTDELGWDDTSTTDEKEKSKDEEVEEEWSYPIGCMLENLEILKSILAVLKVLQTIKRTVLRVLKIGIPLIKVCARCAAAWTCPPSVGEAMQLILEKVTSILIGVAGEVLQMLWDMLQLDCLSNMALELKDQILQILAGGLELWNDMTDKECWTSLRDEYSEAVAEFNEEKDAATKRWEELKKNRDKHEADLTRMSFKDMLAEGWNNNENVSSLRGKLDGFVKGISDLHIPDKVKDVKDSNNEYPSSQKENAIAIEISENCTETKKALDGIEVLF